MARTARWCFTVNNPAQWRPTWSPQTMDYMIWQLERGDKEQTEHVQGYVRFKTRKHMEAAKRLLCDHAHLEPAMGSEESNRAYCSKEGGTQTTENGSYDPKAGKQGRRSDLETVTARILEGTTLPTIAREHASLFVQYHNGLSALVRAIQPPPPSERNVRTVILWGATNIGKSHRVRKAYPTLYAVRRGRGPFDGYTDQKTILFDEFRPADWEITDMNMYMDKWPCPLDCRYYNKDAYWENVYICANSDPDSWWPNDSYLLRDAFFRRVQAIYEVTNRNEIFIL